MRRLISYFMTALLMLALSTSATASDSTDMGLAPFDEGPQDAGFLAFRNQLLATVEARDVKALTAILDAEILNSFGGSGGIDEFHDMWLTGQPDSPLWGALKRLLTNGGCFDEEDGARSFMAPYVWCIVVKTDLMGEYDSALVTEKDAPLFEKASQDARVLKRLDYQVVRITGWPGDDGLPEGYYPIETGSGLSGFMRMDSVSMGLGYRAIFVQRDGRWIMTVLVAGD